MKLVLAFIAGCALMALAYVTLSPDDAASDDAAPVSHSLPAIDAAPGMDLRPVAPRLERVDEQAEPLTVAQVDEPAPESLSTASGLVTEDQLAELVAQRVEQVLSDRERAEREQRDEREAQFIKDRAHAVAEEVGLGLADELRLTDLMLQANDSRDSLRDELRNGAMPFDERMSVRDQFNAIEADYKTGLEEQFGLGLAEQIQSASSNGWRGGGRRGGPPGGRDDN